MIYINNKYKFHKILNINLSKNSINPCIPKAWKLILTSDGSFTQNLNSITDKLIHAKTQEQYILNYQNNRKIIRKVWLADESNRKLTFAESLWYINEYTRIYLDHKTPIGQVFLQSGLDIYKDIEEIYCGHCLYLEYLFKSKDLIWGRKYKVYSNKRTLAIIREFFPSHLQNLINQ